MSEAKQIIVMRTDLNMRKGKMVSQGAHAALKVVLDNQAHPWPALTSWLEGAFVKITVRVDSESELFAVVNEARKAGLHVGLIQDAGRTEFKGVPTYTCAAIGPEFPEDLDPITGPLKLL